MDICPHGERIASMEQRLKTGDGILDELTQAIKDLGNKIVNAATDIKLLSEKVIGKDGLIDTQKEHANVINKINNGNIVDKVDEHDKMFSGIEFTLRVLGVSSLLGVIGMIILIVQLVNLMR